MFLFTMELLTTTIVRKVAQWWYSIYYVYAQGRCSHECRYLGRQSQGEVTAASHVSGKGPIYGVPR